MPSRPASDRRHRLAGHSPVPPRPTLLRADYLRTVLLGALALGLLAGCGLLSPSPPTSLVTYRVDGTAEFDPFIGYLGNEGFVRVDGPVVATGPDDPRLDLLPWQFTFEAERGQEFEVSASYSTAVPDDDTLFVSVQIGQEVVAEKQGVGPGRVELSGRVP